MQKSTHSPFTTWHSPLSNSELGTAEEITRNVGINHFSQLYGSKDQNIGRFACSKGGSGGFAACDLDFSANIKRLRPWSGWTIASAVPVVGEGCGGQVVVDNKDTSEINWIQLYVLFSIWFVSYLVNRNTNKMNSKWEKRNVRETSLIRTWSIQVPWTWINYSLLRTIVPRLVIGQSRDLNGNYDTCHTYTRECRCNVW